MADKNEVLSETEKALYKEINLFQKRTFSRFLIDAIKRDDFDSFNKIVYIIGSQWGVLRTVVKDDSRNTELKNEEKYVKESFSKLVEDLWKNKEKLLNGTYEDWKNDGHPYSYESKICFLVNPRKHRIIYDSHNRRALKKRDCLDNKNCTPEKWENAVEKYFSKNDFSDFSIDDYFLNDCNLWLEGWK
ncbi:MAG: hypothetical protein IJ727_04170 [Treponema sp.]|nr:hypothetical protein [Treponema sp.]